MSSDDRTVSAVAGELSFSASGEATNTRLDLEANPEIHRSIRSFGIEIDTDKIKPALIAEENNELLAGLGVNAYQQEDFENAIINQVDEAIASEERALAQSAVAKTLQEITTDLSCVDGELKILNEAINSLSAVQDYDSKQRFLSLTRQRLNKESQKKRLIARQAHALKQLQEIIQSSLSNDHDAGGAGKEVAAGCAVVEIRRSSKGTASSSPAGDDIASGDVRDIVCASKHNDSVVGSSRHASSGSDDDDYTPRHADWVMSSSSDEEEYGGTGKQRSKRASLHTTMRQHKRKKPTAKEAQPARKKRLVKTIVDDGDRGLFRERIAAWKLQQRTSMTNAADDAAAAVADVILDGGFIIDGLLWSKLYKYQQAGVKWLIELHKQNVGGIVGDEMGLGKTIQIIALLACLRYSHQQKRRSEQLGPVVIVCPTTVLHQWVSEFHKWWPELRVAILHDTGSFTGKREALVKEIFHGNGVLLTSYSSVRNQKDTLLQYRWHYVILDEGHKIRNPDADITLSCKQFSTSHRLILSGSPLQNNLKELWSLCDFVFPGRLGTLPVFMTEFSVPITMGGYANATPVQVQTAYKCACVLRDTISPYLLRRMKKDVNASICLPTKNEQVLFCRLTVEQEQQYKKYLASDQVAAILSGRMKIFAGLTMLRKICNHPDLSTSAGSLDWAKQQQEQNQQGRLDQMAPAEDGCGSSIPGYGHWSRSGKLVVVEALLRLWKEQGHRVLLFSQTRQMLDILEQFSRFRKYSYLRMDGNVTISSRQPTISKFNQDRSIFLFLLTTRVGGLGINLTGANRVIIYDPDWNPSTDMQARERAWRIGQDRHVTIYRLLTTGTIEEKIYHRQIFKQFLTNRILTNPFQRRFFKANDLHELFSFGDDEKKQQTETGAIFAGTGSEIKIRKAGKAAKRKTGHKEERAAVCPVPRTESLEEARVRDDEAVACSSKSPAVDRKPRGKRRRSRNASLDGIRIKNLDKLVGGAEGQHHATEAENSADLEHKQQDDDILKSLFRQSGVHSALKHDRIVESATADYVLVEKEAEKVASQAVAALKNSRREVRRAEIGSVTWTGTQGAAGMPTPSKKPRFGKKAASTPVIPSAPSQTQMSETGGVFTGRELTAPEQDSELSSEALLKKMRDRNFYKLEESSLPRGSHTIPEYDDLLRDLRTFVSHQARSPSQASTQEILNRFKHRVPAGKTTIFREMLKQICNFKRSRGEGVWTLKDEFC